MGTLQLGEALADLYRPHLYSECDGYFMLILLVCRISITVQVTPQHSATSGTCIRSEAWLDLGARVVKLTEDRLVFTLLLTQTYSLLGNFHTLRLSMIMRGNFNHIISCAHVIVAATGLLSCPN